MPQSMECFKGFNLPLKRNPPAMKVHGEVYVQTLSEDDCIFNAPLYCLKFMKGAHTYWRRCPGGIIYVVLAGKGFLGLRGAPLRELDAGEVVRVNPSQEHFIGAGDAECAVLSVLTNLPNNTVIYTQDVEESELKPGNIQ